MVTRILKESANLTEKRFNESPRSLILRFPKTDLSLSLFSDSKFPKAAKLSAVDSSARCEPPQGTS